MMIYVLYIDGQLKGGIKELETAHKENDHDTHTFTLYNKEVWKTYGPVEFHGMEMGGSYYLDSAYSWRLK